MKIYISADIEGVTGVTHWDEADRKHSDFAEYREQMTAEVAAACEGALNAGAEELWVQDAHASARNILASKLPREVRYIRGWSGHPFSMVQELDESFNALMMIGYHSRAGSEGNPLAHTITGRITRIKINDQYASEFALHAYAAASMDVPVVLVSGDAGLCEEVHAFNPHIQTVPVKYGIGESTVSIHPHLAVEQIREGSQKALEGDPAICRIDLPEHFTITITYRDHAKAYQSSFYPGVSQLEPHTIEFGADDYFEVLRLLAFVA